MGSNQVEEEVCSGILLTENGAAHCGRIASTAMASSWKL